MFLKVKPVINCFFSTLVCVVLFISGSKTNCNAQSLSPTSFSKSELEKLVQPIALYPDILLQQILAASTFPEQLIDAALYHEQAKDPKNIIAQPWDDSVKSIANYPSLLTMMVSDIDWTISIASAFVNQSIELKKAIQTLRSKAKALGNLKTSEYETVTLDTTPKGETVIKIESADPQVIYVPSGSYTTVVYQEKVSTSDYLVPVASFGLGMALGYAMADDDDHYYGGYYGPGFWYRDDAVNNWVDYRNDRWDDAYDFANDRQDWRQDNADDWREYRQDLGRDRQDWANQRKANGKSMSPEKRAEVQSKASQFDKDAASQRLNQARSNPQVKERFQSSEQWKSKTAANPAGSFSRSAAPANNYNKGAYTKPSASPYSYGSASANRGSTFSSSSFKTGSSGSNSSLRGISSSSRSVNMAQSRGSTSRASIGGSGRGRR
jgi:hypothetical protein